MTNMLTSKTNSDCIELQTVWDNAINNVSFTTSNNNNNNSESLRIPKYNCKELTELTQPLLNKANLRILFEQILQNYLTNNNISNNNINNNNNINASYLNVLILLDISITISTNTSSIDETLYHLIINLLDTFCEYLSCNKLEIVVNYLTNRTELLFQLSSKWKIKLQSNNKNISNIELPILKFCNKVLNRLNLSSNNISKRGEFLIFMSNFVDIDSRSGQNFLGQFHLENITKTDSFTNNKLKINNTEIIDEKLYNALWDLQNVFNDPRRIGAKLNEKRFELFKINLDLVLESFKNNLIDIDSAAGHFKIKTINTNTKQTNNCKYLTSLRLFNKQLYNPSFRRYILVQMLIFLKSHSVKVFSEHPKLTPLNKFNNKDKNWLINKHIDIVNNILPSVPPNGQIFTKFIVNVLERDEHWLIWKYNKKDKRCSNLKRELPNDFNIIKNGNKNKKRKLSRMNTYSMGDKNLCEIFKYTPSVFKSKRNNIELNNTGKGLTFLKDYQLIDFNNKLNNRLDFIIEEYNQNNKDLSLLNDRKQTFANLRIMRDNNHDMFNKLCPLANNPEPKTFKTEFLLNAIKYHSPNSIKNNQKNNDKNNEKNQNNQNNNNTNSSNGYHTRKHSKSKGKTSHKH